mmetsp:Transcript_43731/g.31882  ORF Transcript_43731/g.31882 Transcript_43731/m.31882 type:complete len:95 (-) Transcript_43731:7-291(-)
MPLNSNLADLNTTSAFLSQTMQANDTIMESGRGTARGGGVEESQDQLIQRYESEDSVHAVDWSASDAWVFAGVSYNGSFVLNLVPSKEKYKILL